MPLSLGYIRIVPLIIEKAHPDFLVRGIIRITAYFPCCGRQGIWKVIFFHLQRIISQKKFDLVITLHHHTIT